MTNKRIPTIGKGLAPLPLNRRDIRLDDAFWSPKLEVLRTVTIKDVFDKFEKSGALANFDRVAQGQRGGHQGPPFFDGLVYETIRAASDFLAAAYDVQLDARLDGYISRIGAAQAAVGDGYINTAITLACPEKRWGAQGGDQLWSHEEYNAGCLVEAGVHHFRATGKTSLLTLSVRFADHLCAVIGPDPRRNIVPSHPLAEEALVKLYQLLVDAPDLARTLGCRVNPREYLRLVRFWMDHRGDHQERISFTEYAQDHCSLYEQPEAVGHAVRGMLLYAGLAALAAEEGSSRDYTTLHRLWRDVVERKLFITGGVGPIKEYEGFGYGYYLPPTGYIETCAGVGLAFWASRMHQLFGGAEYLDVYERVIYNNVLAGISLEGNRYSYENPLYSQGSMHRWDWHGCPCCPPMLLKLFAEMPQLILTQTGTDIYVNLYIGCKAQVSLPAAHVNLGIETHYPWDGAARITLHPEEASTFGLCLRIPRWCRTYTISVNDKAMRKVARTDGYVHIKRLWHDGDQICINLAMPVERIIAHPFVNGLRECTVIQRGPVVYCLEGVDNPQVADPVLPPYPVFAYEFLPGLLGGVVRVTTQAADGAPLVLNPYYTWDNRPIPKEHDWLRVWLRQQDWYTLRSELDANPRKAWGQTLYQPIPSCPPL
ncbi:MAG: glycoside hydrolase family 127 protein [Chloroflexi bacterium]|nr:glycoside hydrolase family 127 protein [Chloroflexota bacterium]